MEQTMTNHPNRSAGLTRFTEKSHISAELIRAVVRQSGGWKDFKEMARDVANHGADGGFSGWIYYTETAKFATRHKAEILEMAKQMADDMGEPLYKMIGGFNCLKISEDQAAEAIHNPRSADRTNVMNALAWFALEEVSRSYSDMLERTE
jgi:hypothetical protein